MNKGRWRLVEKLCNEGLQLADKEAGRLVFKVNGWLAQKRQVGVESVRPDIEAWDTSALGIRFELAKHALLDDFKSVADAARLAFSLGQLSGWEIRNWPLLEEFRSTDDFNSLAIPDEDLGDAGSPPDTENLTSRAEGNL
jgi:hypothetical protein